MRCHRNLTIACMNLPMVKLVSLYTVFLKVAEPVDNVKWRVTYCIYHTCVWGQSHHKNQRIAGSYPLSPRGF